MDSKEFKQAYREILKSIKGLDSIKDNTSMLNEARRAISANVSKIKSCEEIIENSEIIIRDTEQIIEGYDGNRKNFENFLEKQNVFIREAESSIKKAEQEKEEAVKNIDELKGYIDNWNEEDKVNKQKAEEKKANLNTYLGNVRKNAENVFNSDLARYKKEYEDLKAEKDKEKTELAKKYGELMVTLSSRKQLTAEETAVLQTIKDRENSIDKKYLVKLKEKNSQILQLKDEYKDLVECFDKMDKNPDIDEKEIGLDIKQQEEKTPETAQNLAQAEKTQKLEQSTQKPVKANTPKSKDEMIEELKNEIENSSRGANTGNNSGLRKPLSRDDEAIYELKGVERQGKKYYFSFENKAKGKRVEDYDKLGLISSIKEKIKLLSRNTREKYEISALTALRADVNIISHLNSDEKKAYLMYLENPDNKRPFTIKYDKPNRYYARALNKVELEKLPAGQSAEVVNGNAETRNNDLMDRLKDGVNQPIQTPRPYQVNHNQDAQVVQQEEQQDGPEL